MIFLAKILKHNIPSILPQNSIQFAHINLVNNSEELWEEFSPQGNPFVLVMKINDTVVGAVPLPKMKPKEEVLLSFRWQGLNTVGKAKLTLELAEQNVAYLQVLLESEIEFTPHVSSNSENLMTIAFNHNCWYFLPSQGVSWSRHCNRNYPLFVEKAQGSKFWDANGQEFIDYVSGWGACLLGYNEPRVVSAVQQSVTTTCLTTLPNALEMKLTSQLCQYFPSAEMVTFGKNGSDMTTVAVRLARAYTNRQRVFYCGYHGWQDWNAESYHIPNVIPPHNPTIVNGFPADNIEVAKNLFEQYPQEIAAIVIEPAARIESINGDIKAADSQFLRNLADICHSNGTLLIFDEIFTGFRYLKGSVQQAVNIQPDLTCLGKSLGAGMPLSAVIGKRHIFENAIGRIAYDATYKGEPHSFAGAIAALEIYEQEPVTEKVWQFGEKLMKEINQLCLQLKMPCRMVGLPIRMILAIENIPSATLIRTLIQQKLLLAGIVCYRGIMIPAYAHSESDLQFTLKAYQSALESVSQAIKKDNLLEQIEIPFVY